MCKREIKWEACKDPTNPNPFSQGEVNFVETMLYDELEPDDESPT